MSKRLFIKTFGCQMNVYDSERMAHTLRHHGYMSVAAAEDADLVILNTCHIRERAAEKVYSELGRLRLLRDRRRAEGRGEMVLGMTGCVAQAEGDLAAERAPCLDFVLGPQSYHRLPEILARRERPARPVVDTEFPVESKFDALPVDVTATGPVAFLAVQEGCDKFCTFCVVPYTRGAEASRPVNAVLDEARRLVASGARELVLLGQNVNAYHGVGPDGDDWSLADLLGALDGMPGLARLRYTTSHPANMTDDLVAAHGRLGTLMPFLHLPVQSGSDRVLERMNRRGTADGYRRIVDRLRDARHDLALSSDFIVGFPGETDADFMDTLALVENVRFAQAFSFSFSARPGTPAAGLPKQVPEPVKRERLHALQAVLEEQARAFNEACRGRTMAVLVDRPGRHPGQLAGRSPYLQPVVVDAARAAIGDVVEVEIEAVRSHSLIAAPARCRAASKEVDA